MSWKMRLAGIELANFAGAHDLTGVGNNREPVEALVEHVSHKGAWCREVPAHAHMDISNQLLTLGDGDAPLQDP
jgi:hypothetical protein